MLLMGSGIEKRTDADFRSGAIREIGPAGKYASRDSRAMGNEMARDGTRLALFIDGANAHATAKALGFDIDYKRLLRNFRAAARWCTHFIRQPYLKTMNISRSVS